MPEDTNQTKTFRNRATPLREQTRGRINRESWTLIREDRDHRSSAVAKN
jgi:hypothetical protein